MKYRVSRVPWWDFDGTDAPYWADEEYCNSVCSFLNSYIPEEYGRTGTRYHMLNHYPSGKLYFHLLNRPNQTWR